jgi:hypothetical protein
VCDSSLQREIEIKWGKGGGDTTSLLPVDMIVDTSYIIFVCNLISYFMCPFCLLPFLFKFLIQSHWIEISYMSDYD